jgi:hypothetical protein
MQLPSDITGGFWFYPPFVPHPLVVGQVWRKCGPIDALRIESMQFLGCPHFDGGLPGISVRFSEFKRGRVRWCKDRMFIPANNETSFLIFLLESGRTLCKKEA